MPKSVTIEDIVRKAKAYLPRLDEERIRNAYEFAKKAHEGQERFSGEPYIQHPLEVANILLSLKPDEDSIVASLLHDVLEDSPTKPETIQKLFGDAVLVLIRGLEKLDKVHYHGKERQIENLRKMFLAMAKDIRVILIKLADRLHNMRTLNFVEKEEKRQRIAEETLSVYSPIAARLGIYKIKNELDTLCFECLHPEEHKHLTKELNELMGAQKNIIQNSKRALVHALKKAGIQAEIEGRVKNLYSVHKKLRQKDRNYLSEIYDIFALRVIVDTEAQCYQVLGLIHKQWTPLSRRFKDYIAVPKANEYQSLHTTLIGLCPSLHNQPVEVQIRTKEMNEIAEFGIAAHWQYKEKGGIALGQEKLTWVQNLVDLHESLKNNAEFIESLNVDIFHDRIFVLTPNGDVLDLPYDATPVDFAYSVHTKLGHRCKGVKVNGKIVPLDYKLKNGNVVEVITGPAEQPNRYWLSFVITSAAKSSIKQWFNSQDREKILRLGKEVINKKLRQLNKPVLDPSLSLFKSYQGENLSLRDRENLVERVGNGSLNPLDVIKKALPVENMMKPSKDTMAKEALSKGVKLEEKPEILITGEKGLKTIIASCCMPTPKDTIIGYITRGRGVTVHQKTCKVLRGLDPLRLIRATWSTKKMPAYTVKLQINRRSRIGLLRDVADVFAQNQLPILDIENMRMKEGDRGPFFVTASLDSFDTLNKLIHELENVEGVFSVQKVE